MFIFKTSKKRIMKIYLVSKKVGDTLFTAQDGYVEIVQINERNPYPIITETRSNYGLDGKYFDGDKHPTAFNSREEFDAYWAKVKE
jgi:hypothetical protein